MDLLIGYIRVHDDASQRDHPVVVHLLHNHRVHVVRQLPVAVQAEKRVRIYIYVVYGRSSMDT